MIFELVNSSRGLVFMEMLFVFLALAWIVTVYVRRLSGLPQRPYIDVLHPLGHPLPAPAPAPLGDVVPQPSYPPGSTSAVHISSVNVGSCRPTQPTQTSPRRSPKSSTSRIPVCRQHTVCPAQGTFPTASILCWRVTNSCCQITCLTLSWEF